jgi:hypothetical protein
LVSAFSASERVVAARAQATAAGYRFRADGDAGVAKSATRRAALSNPDPWHGMDLTADDS